MKLFNKVSLVEKIIFLQNLEIMIRTGFSLADALRVLTQQTKNKEFHKIIEEMQQFVEGGGNFSVGLKKYPKVFPEVMVNMMAAGETAGKLEKTLKQIVTQLKKTHTLHNKIRNALTYPLIVLFAMLGIGTLMIIFVVPKILMLYEGTTFQLPLPTRIVLGTSRFVTQNGLLVAGTLITLIALFSFILSREKGKYYFHSLLNKTPLVKRIMQQINLAKLHRVFNSLVSTDIPIVESFQIIAKTLSNRPYRYYLQQSAERLRKGETIYTVFKERPDLFPPTVAAMIHVAEESGNLENITNEIANFYEEEVDSTMSNLSVIIEPVLMLLIGAGVGLMAVAIIMPLYGLVNQI